MQKELASIDEHMPGIILISNRTDLAVDLKELSKSLLDIAAHGFLAAIGKPDGPSSTITALINAFSAVKSETNIGTQAWHLFWLCFAWTVDNIKLYESGDEAVTKAAIVEAMRSIELRLDSGSLIMPPSFLDRPITLPIYQVMRDEFIERKGVLRPSLSETDIATRARFDASFERSITEIWMKRPDFVKRIADALEVPGSLPSTSQLQWAAYRKRVVYDFEGRPVFGQESTGISLAQLYIPLRAIYYENDEANDSITISKQKKARLVTLDDELEEWLLENEVEDHLLLIGGGPGSGKSTTTKAFARRLADRVEYRPLYIALQHISLDGNLRDVINEYFAERSGGAFSLPPLSRPSIEDGPQIVLIFDGLDEIARPGAAADEVATVFISKLDQLLSALRGEFARSVRVIVTGRMPSFQAARRFSSVSHRYALEVQGYAPIEIESESKELAAADQRPTWWTKYAPLVGTPSSAPDALTDPRLRDVTNEPLLCYLLALSGLVVESWEDAADNRNLIYERLIDEVWQRGWGENPKHKNRQGPGKSLSKSSFNALMETIALAAWLGGDTRVASSEGFLKTISLMGSESAWGEFKADGGDDVTNLAMNFYLKSSEETQKGFEFTHKSFGDYLAARAILAISDELVSIVDRYPDLALQKWAESTGTGALTHEILVYMRDEIRLRVSRDGSLKYERLLSAFEKLTIIVLKDGVPYQSNVHRTFRELAALQINSETMLWSVLIASIENLGGQDGDRLLELGLDSNKDALRLMLTRLGIDDQEGAPILQCLTRMNAARSNLFGLPLSKSDFSGSNLDGANFSGSHLMNSLLENCSLIDSAFERAHLDECSFDGANLQGSNFSDCRHAQIDFAAVPGIVITRRTLLDVPLHEIPGELPNASSRDHFGLTEEPRLWLRKAKKIQRIFDANERGRAEKFGAD